MSRQDWKAIIELRNQYEEDILEQADQYIYGYLAGVFQELDFAIEEGDLKESLERLIEIYEIAEENDLVPEGSTYPGYDPMNELVIQYL